MSEFALIKDGKICAIARSTRPPDEPAGWINLSEKNITAQVGDAWEDLPGTDLTLRAAAIELAGKIDYTALRKTPEGQALEVIMMMLIKADAAKLGQAEEK